MGAEESRPADEPVFAPAAAIEDAEYTQAAPVPEPEPVLEPVPPPPKPEPEPVLEYPKGEVITPLDTALAAPVFEVTCFFCGHSFEVPAKGVEKYVYVNCEACGKFFKTRDTGYIGGDSMTSSRRGGSKMFSARKAAKMELGKPPNPAVQSL